jgi:HEAT repeat protein
MSGTVWPESSNIVRDGWHAWLARKFRTGKIQDWIERLGAAREPPAIVRVIQAIEDAFGPANVAEVPELIGMLAHADARARYGAAVALAAIGPGARAAAPHLHRALRDKDSQVRHDAAMALKAIKPKHPNVIKRLFRLLLDDDDDVQAAAEEALREILCDYVGPEAARFKKRFKIWCDSL